MFPSSQERVKRLVREWPSLAIGVGLAALVLLGGCFYLRKQGNPVVPGTTATIEPVQADVSAWPEGFEHRLTDGMPVKPEEQPKRWYAVMIENSAEAWPLSGLSQARLVIEAPVEGSIPRFMAYFDDTQTVAKIGPVRSLRPYYLEWATGFKAMPAHVGGSPEALEMVNSTRAADLNEFFWGRFFWRSTDRYAPHNVYTSTELLGEGYEARGYEAVEIPSWTYTRETADAEDLPETQTITIPFSQLTHDYNAVWTYAKEGNAYQRAQDRDVQKDAEGTEVYASNVIVLFSDVQVVDEVGRRHIRTTGTGKSWLFRDGRRFDITWSKDGLSDPLRFVTDSGNDAALNPGNTWIEVVPLSTSVAVDPS